MLKIGRYRIAFGPVFWLQTRVPTTVRHFLWFWFIKEARPNDVDKEQQFLPETKMEYEGRTYRYYRAGSDISAGVVHETTRLRIKLPSNKLAGEEGFEPSLTGPEPAVLPLDDSPKTDLTQSKFSPLPGLLNDILPPILPQKAAGKGLKIQSLLSYPRNCLSCLSLLPSRINPTPFLKALGSDLRNIAQTLHQPRHLWPAGILLASSAREGHNETTDNANETIPLAAPPTPRGTIPRSADETDIKQAPSTLPESVTEVALC